MTLQELQQLTLAVFFIREHGYSFVKTSLEDKETWLCNKKHRTYPIIRISHESYGDTRRNMDRIERVAQAISANINASNRILDLHIAQEPVDETLNTLDTVFIDVNSYEGVDVSKFFPQLKNQLKEVEDVEAEKVRLNNELKVEEMHRSRKHTFWDDLENKPLITDAVMALCITVYLISLFVDTTIQNQSETAVILMGYYKTFVVAGDWWRLLTGGFVHVNLLHLLTNMYALFLMGRPLEGMYGKAKYVLLLLGSIIFGNLFVFVMQGNTVAVGLSGGLYGLMASTLIFAFNSGSIKNPMFRLAVMRTVMINLFINFLPNIAVFAHLGGFVFGALASFLITKNVQWKSMQRNTLVALVILLGALGYKCYDNRKIDHFYPGTDMKVTEYYNNIGLRHYSEHLSNNIFKLYKEN